MPVLPLIHPMHHLIGGGLGGGAEDVVVGAPENFIIAQRWAISAQPGAHGKPGYDGVDGAGDGEEWNLCGSGDVPEIARGNESQSVHPGMAIQFHGAPRDEFLDACLGLRRMAISVARDLCVSEHDPDQPAQRNAASAFFSKADCRANRMLDEPSGENDSLDLKFAVRDHRPQDLRTKRFGENPAACDAFLCERDFQVRGVIIEGPGEGARVGDLHEARAIAKRAFEGGDEGPIAVQSREVNKRGL